MFVDADRSIYTIHECGLLVLVSNRLLKKITLAKQSIKFEFNYILLLMMKIPIKEKLHFDNKLNDAKLNKTA